VSDETKFDPKKFSDVQDRAKKMTDDVFDRAKKFSDDLHEQIHQNVDDQLKNSYRSWKGRRRRPLVVGLDLRARGRGGMITGGILVLIGIAFLLDHLGIISIGSPFRFWPMAIVLVGLLNFIAERRSWGALLMFAGIILQLNELGYTHFGWAQLWPMMLIALGIFVFWGSLEWRNKPASSSTSSVDGDPRTTLNEAVVFGGLERRMTSQDFQGGDVTAIFGGVELDMTEASMQAKEATLAITAIFGGVELRVPPNWQVAFRGAPIFGGIEDKTRTARVADPSNSDLKVLVITGAVIFGGLEIKN
jgi:predicted membrane protein